MTTFFSGITRVTSETISVISSFVSRVVGRSRSLSPRFAGCFRPRRPPSPAPSTSPPTATGSLAPFGKGLEIGSLSASPLRYL